MGSKDSLASQVEAWANEYTDSTQYDVDILTNELKRMLINNIQSKSNIPEGIRNVLINNVVSNVHYSSNSSTVEFVNDAVTRSSIYSNVYKKSETVNLASLADAGRTFKKDPVYYGPYKGSRVKIHLARSSKFANFSAGDFFAETAKEFMAKHPNCTVLVI